MARIATSVEESKRLLELGINPNTADMYWMHVKREGFNDWWKVETIQGAFKPTSMDIPAWSLGALLDLCPYDREIYFSRNRWGMYWIDTTLASMPFDGDYIGAMVKMIELLVNAGYIIKGKEE